MSMQQISPRARQKPPGGGSRVSSAVKLALLAGSAPLLLLPPPKALAQGADEVDEILVTGSRIVDPNLEQASQILVMSEAEILDRHALDAESLVGELPGIAPGISRSINNGSGGFASLNLRGLGQNRNVVLLDGQRIVPTNLSAVTDLNNIPMALVERVDIVTGGASSVYGADAVAGVTNFVTKRDFEGIQIAATTGATGDGDGKTNRIDITIGGNFEGGRGNAVLNLGYQTVDPVLQGDRDFSRVATFGTTRLGSGTSVPTAINGQQYDPATGGIAASRNTFNYAPFNYFQTPLQRFNVFAKAYHEIADNVEVYGNALYSRNIVDLQLAPSGMFGDTWQMPLNNPFLPAAFRNQICARQLPPIPQAACDAAGRAANSQDANYREVPVIVNRRLVEQGNRETEYLTDAFQFTLGARGDISDTMRFDIFGQYGESTRAQTNINWGLKSLLQQSLRATNANTCDPTTNPGTGCVPINLFGNGRNISQSTIDFINKPNGTTVKTSLAAVLATVSGEVDAPGLLPTDLPIGWAAGFEYREYTASQNADVAASTQDEVLGTGAPDPLFKGEYDVNEFFLETIVPLANDLAFVDSLTLEAGVRFSDYSTTGSGTTWKAGATWEPVQGFKIRSIFQESARSPNIFELFNPPTTGLTNLVFDPCQGQLPNGSPNPALQNPDIRRICIAQGAPAATVDGNLIPPPSANQINQTSGGNRKLNVEMADSFTFGFIVTPNALPNLVVTVDYYNIRIEDAITTPGPSDVFRPCFGPGTAGDRFTGANPASPGCRLIGRNPLNGSLNGGGDTLGLITQNTNQGTLETSGIDLRIQYDMETDLGVITDLLFDFTANFTQELLFKASPASINRECVGQFSVNCDDPRSSLPEQTFNLRTTALMGGWGDVSLLWRHRGKMVYEKILNDPFRGQGNQFLTMDAANYFDLTYTKRWGKRWTLSLLVANLFEEDPPITGSFLGSTGWNSGNTYPSYYDVLGRRWSVTGTFRF